MDSIVQERINIGRQYEIQCYSVCYYLLQDEKLAVKAAQEVMTRLIRDDHFRNESKLSIEQYIKKEAMKQSLQIIYDVN